MTARKGKRGSTPQFGGDWTTRKLDLLAGYLHSYTTALKDKPTAASPLRKAFIDAFAGTGYRETRHAGDSEEPASGLLFPDLAEPDPGALLDGSARIALQTQPRFDKYIFIERSQGRRDQLSALKAEFADLAGDIEILAGDANEQIRNICGKDWRSHRAVLFLDPFGMQIEWRTIEAVAKTKAIDLWLLFPLGIGVNRLLTKSGDIPEAWRKRLDLLLGTTNWYDEFYTVESSATLFGESDRIVKATTETIGRYFNDRLLSIFAGGAQEPGVLRNSSNSPLYLFCFDAGNERGKDIAVRFANHLLKELR